ncbi:MAG TPA: hypothetical protein VHQ20_01255 [Patescibacteria group bacterium]|jgi:hypothetical protein|nr:hypothetical protein [Patescibacteria group bacterium]
MKKVNVLLVGSLIALVTGVLPLNFAQASTGPRIAVESLSRSQFRITVTNAFSYSQVNLYSHQSDSQLWNGILNIGQTDYNGRFTTTRTFNSFHPDLAWFWYATVGGQNTPSITTGGNGNNNDGGQVLPASTFANGALVQDNGTVYIIYRGQKSAFANESAFLGNGFSWSNVFYGNTAGIPLVYIISSAGYTSHPWGSWIRSGDTIYFVYETGLIPISSYSIFLNNGGNPNLIVPANWYDMRLDLLSKMKTDDSRLRDK